MLSSYTNNYGTTCSFTYDVYGKRIKTQYGSSQASYFFYDGDRLIAEHMYMLNQSTPTLKVHYLYDNEGVCACKIYYKGTNNNEYAYYTVTKDIFGNIVRLDGEEGCVLKITYSAFGEPTYEIGEPMKVGITGLNAPQNYFRLAFKGYFYDKALKLYYLMSRYYDPETGRFISPDSARYLDPTVFGGLNLYAYCGNNPVTGYDPNGTLDWSSVWNILAGVGVVLLATALTVATAGLGAAALGASATVVGGAMTGALAGGIIAGGINLGYQLANNGANNLNYGNIIGSTVFGGIAGALSGSIGLLSPQNAIGTHLLTNRGMQVGANSAISIMGYLLQSSVNGNTISLDGLLFAGLGGVLSGYYFNRAFRSILTSIVFEALSYSTIV